MTRVICKQIFGANPCWMQFSGWRQGDGWVISILHLGQAKLGSVFYDCVLKVAQRSCRTLSHLP
ncbi:hypothetical protein I7I53_09935 [Histoplasma capsulatum var. duboisii H88]|uniref:Uncharacterized protein n=1 Tax=Ajellomyces capsulatus (strain H88) TaxID=544711 RepID=A0A8A1L6H5_AJEC8|nr:hypothetical protein I7I53_09935 [Histoplasma capsulatum var. duboisii H88]